jgi:hypothetical protein
MAEQKPTMDLNQFLSTYFAADAWGINSDGTITLKWNMRGWEQEAVVSATLSPNSRGHNIEQLEKSDDDMHELRLKWSKEFIDQAKKEAEEFEKQYS